ncbi:MAG TPA: hypothetical protein PK683_19095, partial [Leptospiraceae bacterium]|nr:hypothetical protein [Leptospiraceae bacterium]
LRLFIFAGAVFTVFPVLAGTGADAEIFDPPTNIRTSDGKVLCRVTKVKTIFILARASKGKKFTGWYLTDACSPGEKPGTVWGMVHKSQIRIKSKRSDLFPVDPKKFIQCAENPSNVPESCAAENQAK